MSTATADATLDSGAKRLDRAKRIIRGLMERTEDRGCTESEAMEAAEKIGALLEQFNLNLDEVSVRDVSNMIRVEVFAADDSAGRVIVGIGRLCSLTTYHESGRGVTTYVLFGHKEDVEMATYLYEVVMEAADTSWQADMDRHGYSKKRRESFRMGYATRVSQRLMTIKADQDAERDRHVKMSGSTDLVILKNQLVTAEFAKTGVKLVSRKDTRVIDNGAFSRGHVAGNNVNLRRPLKDGRGIDGALQ